jgi:Domain of unknown function (DUF1330)
MAVYMMFICDNPIWDAAEMKTYSQMVRARPPDPKRTTLCAYGAIEALEGDAPDGIVLLQFPTAEDAPSLPRPLRRQVALSFHGNMVPLLPGLDSPGILCARHR